MNGFAALLAAVALAQEPASGPPSTAPAGATVTPAATPAPAPAATKAPTPASSAASSQAPASTSTPSSPRSSPPARGRGENEATTASTASAPGPSSPPARGAKEPTRASTPTATATATAAATPTSERADAGRIACAFVAALAHGDADTLAQLGAERFSFDGDVQSGRDAVRRTWRALLAGRAGPVPGIGRVEVVSLADAVARHGRPPVRLEPLARPGSLVAIADVGGRTVVLFLAREGTRLAVTGMHD